MRPRDPNSRPVFSSDDGELCPDCGQAALRCLCEAPTSSIPRGDQIRIAYESKGRGGKAVSLVKGLPLADEALKELAKDLKKCCGTGGAVKDGVIEIQGDHREMIEAELAKRGFRAKRAGGP